MHPFIFETLNYKKKKKKSVLYLDKYGNQLVKENQRNFENQNRQSKQVLVPHNKSLIMISKILNT